MTMMTTTGTTTETSMTTASGKPLRWAFLGLSLALLVFANAPARADPMERMYELYLSSSTPKAVRHYLRDRMLDLTRRRARSLRGAPASSARPAAFSRPATRSLAVAGAPAAATRSAATAAIPPMAGFVSPRLAAGVYRQDGTGVQLPVGAVKEDVLIKVEEVR